MTRFRVLTVEGWAIRPDKSGDDSRSKSQPGLSATVYDSIYDRDIATYRTEMFGGPRKRVRRQVLWLAEAHAERLNAEHDAEQAA